MCITYMTYGLATSGSTFITTIYILYFQYDDKKKTDDKIVSFS